MEKPKIIGFEKIKDRGADIIIAQGHSLLPFEVERFFWLQNVPEGAIRGEHAHKSSRQILICQKGVVTVDLLGIDGKTYHFNMNQPTEGLYIPPLFWGKIVFGKDAILLTVASDIYKESDYIRNFNEFQKLIHVDK